MDRNSSPQMPRRRGQQNRSSEEEYAGPLQLLTPSNSVSPEPPPQPKRLKRSRGSSSDETQNSSQAHSFIIEDSVQLTRGGTISDLIMDWALITVDSGRVPARNELPLSVCNIPMLSSQMNKIGSLALAQEVFKIGRRSNQTHGFVSPVATTELLTWENHNGTLIYNKGESWAVMERRGDDEAGKGKGSKFFSDKGDSGSAVFTRKGEFVGLLHAGVEPWGGITYVTSAQDLMEDIKHITGAVEVTML